ncbi:DUF3293 domain-containing protein [Calidithermus roseus]|uniref:DUF3293 domain-containing protein n=1 Tax=Calidithermus roseus TaxID=1644118 RepID=A0A399EIF6_9DEIN|nr:DUF3293 domain-containing protein [Calidithermus roseus]RIH84504.1 hypothetical protein Mrose_02606 [Calidithermus roseus]
MGARTLSQVYRAAVYEAGGVVFTLGERPTGVTLFGGRAFAIITAHNPGSQRLSDGENARRHRELEQVLREGGYELAPGVGCSPDGEWREEGFTVFGVGLEEALAVGRRFGQNAIVYGQGERVALAWCESGELEWFYPAQPNAIPGSSPGR